MNKNSEKSCWGITAKAVGAFFVVMAFSYLFSTPQGTKIDANAGIVKAANVIN